MNPNLPTENVDGGDLEDAMTRRAGHWLSWRLLERVVLLVTLLVVIGLQLEVQQIREEQRVQACYARITGFTVMRGFEWTGHRQADTLARNNFHSCTEADFRDKVISDTWGRNDER